MPPEGLLLLIETPTASAHDVDQLRALGLVRTLALLQYKLGNHPLIRYI